jgi:hypothetical protein
MRRHSLCNLVFVGLAVVSCGCAPRAVSDPRPGELAATTVPSSPPAPAHDAASTAPPARAVSDVYSLEATKCSVVADC